MKCVGLTKTELHADACVRGCFLHGASTFRKLSPMILGFCTRLAHENYHKAYRKLIWKIPFVGPKTLWTWDVSNTHSMAVRHAKLAEFLAAPSKWD